MLILKCIEKGVTTSLTRNDEIIFEGQKYAIKGKNVQVILERIARMAIKSNHDVLVCQYKEHQPIFPKRDKNGKTGMTRSANDVKEIQSIIDEYKFLSNERWLLSKLTDQKNNNDITWYLEQRTSQGDHIIYKWN